MLNKINWGVSASHTSWLCMVCFVVYQFFQQGVIGILSTPLREDFQLNSASLSLLSSSFYFPYLLMQIPVGILYDRYGLKNAACTALVASIASLIWFASAPTFTSLIIARMAMGTTSAFAFVGMLITIQRLLPKTNFALFMALGECVAMWMVGIANQVVSSCNEVYGWRPSLIPIALFGLLIVTVLWIFGQDIPANSTNSPNLMKQMHKSKVGGGIQPWVWVARLPSQGRIFFAKLGKTFALRSVWAAGAFSGLAFSVVSVFQALWLIPYLEHIHEMETQEATRISSMLYLG
ncbi:MAG: MFS transporter, partial [Zetaproteobacteria bacterium]|nr:MFS transporter [Zetaproteobacteria bacterium]